LEWRDFHGLGKVTDTDVLVIGGGLAGAFAALKAKEEGAEKVVLVEKGRFGSTGCSAFAAGVVQPFLGEEDDFGTWFEASVKAADYLIDQDILRMYLDEAQLGIEEMDRWGVDFVKKDGKLERLQSRYADSSKPGIKTIMFKGGIQMMDVVTRRVAGMGVETVNRVMTTDLLVHGGRAVGAVGFDTTSGDFLIFRAKATVLATGGIAFKDGYHATKNLTGDGHAMAYRAGVELMSYEFMPQHIMTRDIDVLGFTMFVGLGARFVNSRGEDFMGEYDPRLRERTSLGKLALAITLEHEAGRGPIYLDMTHFSPEQVKRLSEVVPMFALIAERAGAMEGDSITERLEILPCTFGNISRGGGVRVLNERFETSLPGLYVAGPGTAAPRAGTALTESLVSGTRAGRFAAQHAKGAGIGEFAKEHVEALREWAFEPYTRKDGIEPDLVVTSLQETIIPSRILVILTEDKIRTALQEVERVKETELPRLFAYDPHYLRMADEARNMVQCAELWLRCAMVRQESRPDFGFWREDHPYVDNGDWLKWTAIRKEGEGYSIVMIPVPIERYRLKPEKRERANVEMFEIARRRGRHGRAAH